MNKQRIREIRKRKKLFPWLQAFYSKYAEKFLNGNKEQALEYLLINVEDEIKALNENPSEKKASELYNILNTILLHLSWKQNWSCFRQWKSYWKKVESPCINTRNGHEKYHSKLLYYLLNLSILLTDGNKESEWIIRILTIFKMMPNLLDASCSALLFVDDLKKKYSSIYYLIVKEVLLSSLIKEEVNSVLYSKIILLFRRLLKFSKTEVERKEVLSVALKVRPPTDFMSWLSWIDNNNIENLREKNITEQLLSRTYPDDLLRKLQEILIQEGKSFEKADSLSNANHSDNEELSHSQESDSNLSSNANHSDNEELSHFQESDSNISENFNLNEIKESHIKKIAKRKKKAKDTEKIKKKRKIDKEKNDKQNADSEFENEDLNADAGKEEQLENYSNNETAEKGELISNSESKLYLSQNDKIQISDKISEVKVQENNKEEENLQNSDTEALEVSLCKFEKREKSKHKKKKKELSKKDLKSESKKNSKTGKSKYSKVTDDHSDVQIVTNDMIIANSSNLEKCFSQIDKNKKTSVECLVKDSEVDHLEQENDCTEDIDVLKNSKKLKKAKKLKKEIKNAKIKKDKLQNLEKRSKHKKKKKKKDKLETLEIEKSQHKKKKKKKHSKKNLKSEDNEILKPESDKQIVTNDSMISNSPNLEMCFSQIDKKEENSEFLKKNSQSDNLELETNCSDFINMHDRIKKLKKDKKSKKGFESDKKKKDESETSETHLSNTDLDHFSSKSDNLELENNCFDTINVHNKIKKFKKDKKSKKRFESNKKKKDESKSSETHISNTDFDDLDNYKILPAAEKLKCSELEICETNDDIKKKSKEDLKDKINLKVKRKKLFNIETNTFKDKNSTIPHSVSDGDSQNRENLGNSSPISNHTTCSDVSISELLKLPKVKIYRNNAALGIKDPLTIKNKRGSKLMNASGKKRKINPNSSTQSPEETDFSNNELRVASKNILVQTQTSEIHSSQSLFEEDLNSVEFNGQAQGSEQLFSSSLQSDTSTFASQQSTQSIISSSVFKVFNSKTATKSSTSSVFSLSFSNAVPPSNPPICNETFHSVANESEGRNTDIYSTNKSNSNFLSKPKIELPYVVLEDITASFSKSSSSTFDMQSNISSQVISDNENPCSPASSVYSLCHSQLTPSVELKRIKNSPSVPENETLLSTSETHSSESSKEALNSNMNCDVNVTSCLESISSTITNQQSSQSFISPSAFKSYYSKTATKSSTYSAFSPLALNDVPSFNTVQCIETLNSISCVATKNSPNYYTYRNNTNLLSTSNSSTVDPQSSVSSHLISENENSCSTSNSVVSSCQSQLTHKGELEKTENSFVPENNFLFSPSNKISTSLPTFAENKCAEIVQCLPQNIIKSGKDCESDFNSLTCVEDGQGNSMFMAQHTSIASPKDLIPHVGSKECLSSTFLQTIQTLSGEESSTENTVIYQSDQNSLFTESETISKKIICNNIIKPNQSDINRETDKCFKSVGTNTDFIDSSNCVVDCRVNNISKNNLSTVSALQIIINFDNQNDDLLLNKNQLIANINFNPNSCDSPVRTNVLSNQNSVSTIIPKALLNTPSHNEVVDTDVPAGQDILFSESSQTTQLPDSNNDFCNPSVPCNEGCGMRSNTDFDLPKISSAHSTTDSLQKPVLSTSQNSIHENLPSPHKSVNLNNSLLLNSSIYDDLNIINSQMNSYENSDFLVYNNNEHDISNVKLSSTEKSAALDDSFSDSPDHDSSSYRTTGTAIYSSSDELSEISLSPVYCKKEGETDLPAGKNVSISVETTDGSKCKLQTGINKKKVKGTLPSSKSSKPLKKTPLRKIAKPGVSKSKIRSSLTENSATLQTKISFPKSQDCGSSSFRIGTEINSNCDEPSPLPVFEPPVQYFETVFEKELFVGENILISEEGKDNSESKCQTNINKKQVKSTLLSNKSPQTRTKKTPPRKKAKSTLTKSTLIGTPTGKLSDLKLVLNRFACYPIDYLTEIHKLLFLTDCDPEEIRQNIFAFKGFNFGPESEEFQLRKLHLGNLPMSSLKKISSVLTTRVVGLKNPTKVEFATHLSQVLEEYCKTYTDTEIPEIQINNPSTSSTPVTSSLVTPPTYNREKMSLLNSTIKSATEEEINKNNTTVRLTNNSRYNFRARNSLRKPSGLNEFELNEYDYK